MGSRRRAAARNGGSGTVQAARCRRAATAAAATHTPAAAATPRCCCCHSTNGDAAGAPVEVAAGSRPRPLTWQSPSAATLSRGPPTARPWRQQVWQRREAGGVVGRGGCGETPTGHRLGRRPVASRQADGAPVAGAPRGEEGERGAARGSGRHVRPRGQPPRTKAIDERGLRKRPRGCVRAVRAEAFLFQ